MGARETQVTSTTTPPVTLAVAEHGPREAEAHLLKTLAIHAHSPVERMTLSPDTADVTGRAVDVQVTRLRRKLEADPKNPRYLQTVRGVGYMLAPD